MRYEELASACVLAAVVLAGCEAGPNYTAPHAPVPAAFDASATTQPAEGSAAATVDMTHWWHSLKDPELDSLVDRAIRSNLDLRMALMRLQQSRAEQYIVAAGMFPFIGASGTGARGSGTNSTKGRIAPPLNAGSNTTGLTEITHVLGFDAGWELDLVGRFRRELEAAAADTQAAAEARNAILITLISDVARVYVDVRTTQDRLDIARQNIAVGEQTLNVVTERFNRGLTNELDVALARRQLASERASVAPLENELTQARHRLAVLLGQTPESLQEELAVTRGFPAPAAKIITGLPVDLLRRRPDIRQAERRLAAQNARIGVAMADLFPRVMLTAGLGLQGQGLGRLPVTSSLLWSFGPTASAPLLDFGRIDSAIMFQDLRTQELVYDYQRTVLGAVEEVDNAANGYAVQRAQLDQLAEAVDASRLAQTLAMGRYERGLVDFLNVLDAQRQVYMLEDQVTVSRQELVLQYVSLYKALGGGWETYQEVPQLRMPLPAVIAAPAEMLGQRPRPVAGQTPSSAPTK